VYIIRYVWQVSQQGMVYLYLYAWPGTYGCMVSCHFTL